MFAAVITAAHYVGPAITWGIKVARAASAAKNTYDALTKDDLSLLERTAKIGTGVFFVGAEAADVATHIMHVSNLLQFEAAAAAGAGDVANALARDGASLDTLATAAFRAADVSSQAMKVASFVHHKAGLAITRDISTSSFILISSRKVIISGLTITSKGVRSLVHKIISYCNSSQATRITYKAAPTKKGTQARPSKETELQSVSIKPETLSPEEKAWIQEHLQEQRKMVNWEKLDTIPKAYHEDAILSGFICPITGQPIRHILTLNTDSEEAPLLYFERAAVNDWIENKSSQAPEGWPQELFSLPIKQDHFKPCRHAQHMINKQLKIIATETQSVIDGFTKECAL